MNNARSWPINLASVLIVAISLILLLPLKLLPCLIAGLLIYEIIDSITKVLQQRIAGRVARLLAVGILTIIVITALTIAFTSAFSFLMHEANHPEQLLKKLLMIIEKARNQLPESIDRYLPATAEDIKNHLSQFIMGHLAELRNFGKGAAHLFVTVLIGMVLGAIIALQPTPSPNTLRPLAEALFTRVSRFAQAFHDIVFAQIKISMLNTFFTAIFLLTVPHIFGEHLPLVKTLILLTFIVGLLPVIGNLISNTVIFIVAMSVSFWVASCVLLYLILIHKLEYFLNARIVGGQIRARAWELLIAMLVFEAAFGLAGVIAAPIYYAYLKSELRAEELV
ncbi:AI-2E family transporter [Entomomonas asaccharolytica]|uniref:AI-2E family transporter n=1 Tax=Entomomonas asaccharolytica TaxID=2785331 RepID=A0A974NEG0_9GAMM|nr:AI-2E family transporter [Entomomonas asaccharolytica]QQP84902.1 AI-2E family transporter [Entomomonas asaccharolytica]